MRRISLIAEMYSNGVSSDLSISVDFDTNEDLENYLKNPDKIREDVARELEKYINKSGDERTFETAKFYSVRSENVGKFDFSHIKLAAKTPLTLSDEHPD